MRASKRLTFFLTLIAFGVGGASAQQPTPPMIIVQAANAPVAATPAPVAAAAAAPGSIDAAIKLLEQTKAANEETLKKQEALLQELDEIQKAAEQLKIFSKRV